jgi:hypothetical protein
LAGTFDVLRCVGMMLVDARKGADHHVFETAMGRRFTRLAPRACWYDPCTTPSGCFSASDHFREEAFMQFRPATLIVVACVAAAFGFAGAASRTCATPDPAQQTSFVSLAK